MAHSVSTYTPAASSDAAIAFQPTRLPPLAIPTGLSSTTDASGTDFSSELRHHETSQEGENSSVSGLESSAKASKATEHGSVDPAQDETTSILTGEKPAPALPSAHPLGHRSPPGGVGLQSFPTLSLIDPAAEPSSAVTLAAIESKEEGREFSGDTAAAESDIPSSAAEDLLRILSLGHVTSSATVPIPLPLQVSARAPALGAALSSAETDQRQGSSSFALPETSRAFYSADVALPPEIFGQGMPSVTQWLSALPSVAAAVGRADRNFGASVSAASSEMQASAITGLAALPEPPLVNPEGNAEPAAAPLGLAAETMGEDLANKAHGRSSSRLFETFEPLPPEVGTPEAAMGAGGTSTARSVESMPEKFEVIADTDMNPSLLTRGSASGQSLMEGAQTAAGAFEEFDSQQERQAQAEDRASGVLSSLSSSFETRVASASELEPESVILSPLSLQPGAALRQEILSRVMEVRSQGSGSMNVVLRPDAGTQLSVQLRSYRGDVEVRVVMERGEAGPLREAWQGLQQSLAQQGVRLSDLDASRGASRDALAQQFSSVTSPDLDRLKVLDSGPSGFGGSDPGSNSGRPPRSPVQDPFLANDQGNSAGRDRSRAQDPSNPQVRASLGIPSVRAGSQRAISNTAGVTPRSPGADHLETWA